MLDWDLLKVAVDRATTQALSTFPAHHEADDVRQTLYVWIMENKGTVSRICADSEGSDTALVQLLVRAANSYLKTEEAAVYGYSEEDQYNYSVDLIKSILEVVFRHEDWQSFASALDAMPRVKKDPSQGGNNLASYADVKSAVEKLPEEQYNTLVWRYKYSLTFQQIGTESGVTKQGAQDRHRAALNSVQLLLGKRDLSDFRQGYDGRQESRGTASGVARVERDYEG